LISKYDVVIGAEQRAQVAAVRRRAVPAAVCAVSNWRGSSGGRELPSGLMAGGKRLSAAAS
jgi:hypothetical protein